MSSVQIRIYAVPYEKGKSKSWTAKNKTFEEVAEMIKGLEDKFKSE
jgi:hypothetical protein